MDKDDIFETLPAGISSARIDKIAPALSKAQASVEGAVADSTGAVSATQKYQYADIESIYKACRQAVSDNALSVIYRFAPNNMLHIFLLHDSGQWIDYGEYPIGNATEHKQRGGALTYIRRFSMKAIFALSDTDDEAKNTGNDALGKETPKPEVKPDPKPEYRPSDPVRPGKDKFVIPCPILLDGSLDFDAFAADLESVLESAKDINEISMWNRANAKTLKQMQTDRPDLFNAIGEKFRSMSAALQ